MIYQDGIYYWTCEVDKEYKRHNFRVTMMASFIISIALILVTVLTTSDATAIGAMFLTCILVIVIALIIGLWKSSPSSHLVMPYQMNEQYVCIGKGKSSYYVNFKYVNDVETRDNKIILHTRFSKTIIFVPEEDYTQIKEYILRRVEEERIKRM